MINKNNKNKVNKQLQKANITGKKKSKTKNKKQKKKQKKRRKSTDKMHKI